MAVSRYTVNVTSEGYYKSAAIRDLLKSLDNALAYLPPTAEVTGLSVADGVSRYEGWYKMTARIRIKVNASEYKVS